uniref:C-C motif chemokine n=1 Tax=Electrophorus electricus TaxID=8005 RepID=A0A4W4F034_ELEEL
MTKVFVTVSSLLVLLCVWASLGEASLLKCCTNFSPHPLPFHRLKDFTVQDATTTCRLHAIIFTTVKNRRICANPKTLWVKHAVVHLRKNKSALRGERKRKFILKFI